MKHQNHSSPLRFLFSTIPNPIFTLPLPQNPKFSPPCLISLFPSCHGGNPHNSPVAISPGVFAGHLHPTWTAVDDISGGTIENGRKFDSSPTTNDRKLGERESSRSKQNGRY